MEPMFQASSKKYSMAMKKQLRASPPVVLSQDIPPGTKLTFVDIAHNLATIHVDSKMNQFSALIDAANDWLQKNYLWKVLSCETVPLVFKSEKLDQNDYGATKRLLQPHINHDLGETIVLKSLRLWILRRNYMPEMKKNIDIQLISCSTFLPKSCEYFENQIGWEQLDDVVETINESIRSSKIKGKLLNIESINYDADDEWFVDTECSRQKEFTSKQVTIIRVYYESGQEPAEEVAIFDFVPEIIYASVPPKFEPFSSVLNKAQEFLEDNNEYKLLNAQSFDIKFRSAQDIQSHFMIHNNETGYYLRVLRIVCTKPFVPKTIRRLTKQKDCQNTFDSKEMVLAPEEPKQSDNVDPMNDPAQASISSKRQAFFDIEAQHFEIVRNNTLHGPFYPVKRAIEEFMDREEWNEDEKQKWNFLCAETIVVLAKDENDICKKIENSLFSNRHNVLLVPRVYYVIRIYFDTSLIERKKIALTGSKSLDKDLKLESLPSDRYPGCSPARPVKNRVIRSVSCVLL